VKKDNKRLLKESSYPSYMVFSISEMEEIFESFANIFKSVWSSIKLLSNTLLLNLKLITYNVTLDKKKIAAAKEEFATSRATYDTETKKNLKYFRKYYSDSNIETLWGTGPGILAFIANPFLFIATNNVDNSYFPSESEQEAAAAAQRAKEKESEDKNKLPADPSRKPVFSEKLKYAMQVFGFRLNLSEQTAIDNNNLLEQAQANQHPEAAIKEAARLKEIARRYVDTETIHAKNLSLQISGRAAVIKKIVDASNFDEMIAAAAEGEKIKMGLSSSAFKASAKNINESLEKQLKEDPKAFKQSIADMRQRTPEITEKDDVKAMSQFLFGVSKSRIQKQATSSYEGLVLSAKNAMQLPLDAKVVKQLEKDNLGKQYLTMLENFEKSLETGQQEMLKISKEKI
jgi:hypothetical protein